MMIGGLRQKLVPIRFLSVSFCVSVWPTDDRWVIEHAPANSHEGTQQKPAFNDLWCRRRRTVFGRKSAARRSFIHSFIHLVHSSHLMNGTTSRISRRIGQRRRRFHRCFCLPIVCVPSIPSHLIPSVMRRRHANIVPDGAYSIAFTPLIDVTYTHTHHLEQRQQHMNGKRVSGVIKGLGAISEKMMMLKSNLGASEWERKRERERFLSLFSPNPDVV